MTIAPVSPIAVYWLNCGPAYPLNVQVGSQLLRPMVWLVEPQAESNAVTRPAVAAKGG